SHEELYGMLDEQRVDVIFNDQWQVLSDDYERHLIDKATTIIEVPQGYTKEGSVEINTIDDLPLILICRGKYTTGEV
ncbi:LysR family transcriptional regulator, partial [Veillonella sp. ZSJB6]